MHKRVVTIIDYRASRGMKGTSDLLEKMERKGKVIPNDWKKNRSQLRSLTVFDDGSCLLHSLTAQSMIRKMRKGSILKEVLQ